jgi:hypothetical protein
MANIQDDLQTRWWDLEKKLMDQFGKKPDTEAVLFLIGLQETGFIREKITKEQKNLMEQEVFLKDHILLYFDNIRY